MAFSFIVLLAIHLFLIEMMCMGHLRFPIPGKDTDMTYIPYNQSPDKYVLLRSSIFNMNVYNSTRAGVVEFYYSQKDEHWKEFLYIWEIFAKSINNWHNIVVVESIDCANRENVKLCRYHNIQHYPTIRYFAAPIKNFDVGKTITIEILNSTKSSNNTYTSLIMLRREIIKCLQSTETKLPNWPHFSPMDSESIRSLQKPNKADLLILIIENNNSSFVGRELMLDLWDVKNVEVRYTFDKDLSNIDEDLPQAIAIGNMKDGKGNGNVYRITPITNASRYLVFKIVQRDLKKLGYAVPDYRGPLETDISEFEMEMICLDRSQKQKGATKENRFISMLKFFLGKGIPSSVWPLLTPNEYKPLISG